MEKPISSGDTQFDTGFLKFYHELDKKYTSWAWELKDLRDYSRLNLSNRDEKLDWQDFPSKDLDDFKIQLPPWCLDQRNQMTGPADNAELTVKMINSGSPGVMLDLEDSMANDWEAQLKAYDNVAEALTGDLTYEKNDKLIGIEENPTIFIRPRGLHMMHHLEFPQTLTRVTTSASLLDVAIIVYSLSDKLTKLKHPISFYIPKSESADEAKWWSSLFKDLARKIGMHDSYIKCMALVESAPLAYQMDEFIFNLKDHILGLNLGRWDYMASLIDFNPRHVLPDRNTIPSDIRFFQNLRKLMVNTCHKRGILAIGGMTALYPDRKNPQVNKLALEVLEKDKNNEAQMGMDGAWTGHPDQNNIALSQFPSPNQLSFTHPTLPGKPDLSIQGIDDLINEGFKVTDEGTRALIRASIRYRYGVLKGKGASLLDGYMEDLATDRICRLMIQQRLNMNYIDLNKFKRLFEEETAKLLNEFPDKHDTLVQAKELTMYYIENHINNPA